MNLHAVLQTRTIKNAGWLMGGKIIQMLLI